jgi:hypothetical protein
MGDLLELIPIELLDILFSYVDGINRYLVDKYPLLLTDVEWAQVHFPEVLKQNPHYWRFHISQILSKRKIPYFGTNLYSLLLEASVKNLINSVDKIKYFKKVSKALNVITYGGDDNPYTIIYVIYKELQKVLPSKLLNQVTPYMENNVSSNWNIEFIADDYTPNILMKLRLNRSIFLPLVVNNNELAAEILINLLVLKNNLE